MFEGGRARDFKRATPAQRAGEVLAVIGATEVGIVVDCVVAGGVTGGIAVVVVFVVVVCV